MRSMTGFGAGEAPLGEGRAVVEVRSLNHRYLEVRTSVSVELSRHAWVLEREAHKSLERGRYDVTARVVGVTPLAPRFDVERARIAYRSLGELRDELAPGTELPVAALTTLPDLFGAPTQVDADAISVALRAALDKALAALDLMRLREGEALRQDLAACLERMREQRAAIAERTRDSVARHHHKLRERVAKLVADVDVPLDTCRLESEVALLADRLDVSEELVRLESHFCQLNEMLAVESAAGRKIDFLPQEVGREVNTLSAKSQDAEVSQRAVELKAELARMRQQVQNVA